MGQDLIIKFGEHIIYFFHLTHISPYLMPFSCVETSPSSLVAGIIDASSARQHHQDIHLSVKTKFVEK
jgi:hypothetical protein